jgi:hypothetical protein
LRTVNDRVQKPLQQKQESEKAGLGNNILRTVND